jgi:hypothetical protein
MSIRNNILPVLANDIFYYTADDKNDSLVTLNRMSAMDLFEIMRKEGIHIETFHIVDNLVDKIIEIISHNGMVLLSVDAMCISAVSEFYQKGHHPNFLLIFGINIKLGHVDYISTIGVTTSTRQCSINEIIDGYAGFITNFSKENSFVSFYMPEAHCNKQDNRAVDDFRDIFIAYYAKNKDVIRSGIENIKSMYKYMNNISSNPLLFLEAYNENKFYFNTVLVFRLINRSLSQSYQQLMLFPNNRDIISNRESISCNWALIRAIIVKYTLTGKIQRSSIDKLCQALNDIYHQEIAYHYSITGE